MNVQLWSLPGSKKPRSFAALAPRMNQMITRMNRKFFTRTPPSAAAFCVAEF